MTMPTSPESSIFDSAALVMLHGGARPMVDGVAQADVSGLSHKNDFALARSLGDWRDARQASQGVVISPSQRIRGFCEQRGEDDPSNARQGSQDRHVTLLIELTLGILLSISEPLSQMVDAVIGLADLAVDEIEPLGDGFEMGRRRVHGSGGGRDGWRFQPFDHPSCCQAADAMAFEEPVDRCLAHAHCLVRCWDQTPQVEEPAGGDIVGKFEKLRIITPQKFPDAIAKPIALGAQVVGDTRPFAQLHDGRINWPQGPEAARIGPERIGENLGVAAVVLGAGGREAITKAIELLWIDGVNPETTLHQAFDDGAMWDLDRDEDGIGRRPVNFKVQATISASPWPPCAKARSPTLRPLASDRRT